MNTPLSTTRGSLLGPILVIGSAAAIAVWITWFITHLPWLQISEQNAIIAIVVVWFLVVAGLTSRLPSKRCIPVGIAAGVLATIPGLLILGSKLAKPANPQLVSDGLIPNAGLITAAFIGLGAAIGLLAGTVGRLASRPHEDQPASYWLTRFALVTCLATVPLLTVGGLVTSTNSGMAVPDWPTTYAANMFLYPLSTDSRIDIYLEHTHRLFGTLLGLLMLVLVPFVWVVDKRRFVKVLVTLLLLIVIIQGLIGAKRVLLDNRLLAMFHGVLAQLTFATLVGLTVMLSSHFRAIMPGKALVDAAVARRARLFGTAAMHTLILQLILGAWYRHFRQDHPLWTHIGFSIIVTVFIVLAGFTLSSPALKLSPVGRRTVPIGLGIVAVVFVQFALGWATFFAGGRGIEAENVVEALLRTSHQANGALLMGLVAAAFVWGRRLGAHAKLLDASARPGTPSAA